MEDNADDIASKPDEAQKKKVGKPFEKGDSRINRRGRPKNIDAVRQLAQSIAHEVLTDSNGDPVIRNGHAVTVAEGILRSAAASTNPRFRMWFFEWAFGKMPESLELTGVKKLLVEYVDAEPGQG